MQYIFENSIFQERDGRYYTNSIDTLKTQEISDKIKNACKLLDDFNKKIVEMRGESHEE